MLRAAFVYNYCAFLGFCKHSFLVGIQKVYFVNECVDCSERHKNPVDFSFLCQNIFKFCLSFIENIRISTAFSKVILKWSNLL